ncbi:hypothetical protein B296_00009879, partial [Ensete ventricosum]
GEGDDGSRSTHGRRGCVGSAQARTTARNSRSDQSIASIHGAVLALTASVLSVPYDMPREDLGLSGNKASKEKLTVLLNIMVACIAVEAEKQLPM